MQQNVEPGSALWLAIESYILLLESIPTNIPTTVSFMSTGYTGKRGVDQGGMPDVPTTTTTTTNNRVPRAHGGPVFAGESYLVGEQGPELLTMGASGFVTPNNRLGGGSTTTIVNVYPRTMPTDTELIDLVNKIRRRGGQV